MQPKLETDLAQSRWSLKIEVPAALRISNRRPSNQSLLRDGGAIEKSRGFAGRPYSGITSSGLASPGCSTVIEGDG